MNKTKGTKGRRTRATPVADPMERVKNARREFFSALLERIKHLPPTSALPEEIQQAIRQYAGKQLSEKGFMLLLRCQNTAILSFVLENLLSNLGTFQPATLINTLIASSTRKETPPEERIMNYNERIIYKLRQFLRNNLTIYIDDPALPPKDMSISQLQKSLEQEFGKIFEPLFANNILTPETIKRFLSTSDFISPNGTLSIDATISKFMQEHRYDRIIDLLNSGFRPQHDEDWENVLPEAYYNIFPKTLWKLRHVTNCERFFQMSKKYPTYLAKMSHLSPFERFVELSKRFAVSLDDFIKYTFYTEKIPMIDQDEETTTTITELPPPKKSYEYLKFRNENHDAFFQRIRPWIDNLVSVVITPLDDRSSRYIGTQVSDTEYFFPTTQFFQDLVSQTNTISQLHNDGIITITINPENIHNVKVAHLLSDGRIEPQKKNEFIRGCEWMKREFPISVAHTRKIQTHLAETPFSKLLQNDILFIRKKIASMFSIYLSLIYKNKLDMDRIVNDIMPSINQDTTLENFLSKCFHIMLWIDPSYCFHRICPWMHERLNLFLYNLQHLSDLPIPFFFPQYPLLEKQQQNLFSLWYNKNRQAFLSEIIQSLLHVNYPILRVSASTNSIKTMAPESLFYIGESLIFLTCYQGDLVDLQGVSRSILSNEEFIVNGLPLKPSFITEVEHFFNIERLEDGFLSSTIDNGYEIATEENKIIVHKTETSISSDPEIISLPDFKTNAFDYLHHLMSL